MTPARYNIGIEFSPAAFLLPDRSIARPDDGRRWECNRLLVRLLFLFVALPLIELTLLLMLAEATDWRFTLLLVLATGIVGTFLARSQGFRTYQRIQQQLAEGQMPTDSLVDAMMILLAGALLVTPGVLTDLFGMSLLIPFFRRWYRGRLKRWFQARFTVHTNFTTGDPDSDPGSRVIDSYVVDDRGAPDAETDRDP